MNVPESPSSALQVVTSMPPDLAARLVDLLGRVEPMMVRFDMAMTRPPAAGSAAAVEEPDGLGHYAYHLAACDLRVALDNLNAWRLLLARRGGALPSRTCR